MNNFTFYCPTYFAFGKGEEARAGQLVKRFGGSRVLLHYGGGSAVRSGLLDRVKRSLEENGIFYTAYSPIPAAAWSIRALRCAGRKISISCWLQAAAA